MRVVPTPVAVPSFTALRSAWLVCTAAVASPMCDFSLCSLPFQGSCWRLKSALFSACVACSRASLGVRPFVRSLAWWK